MNSHVLPGNNQNESWTDEKHVRFLNSMEAWFVRTMLENNDLYHRRLDRHLPDSSESTLDCKRHNVQSRRKHASSEKVFETIDRNTNNGRYCSRRTLGLIKIRPPAARLTR
ncbi:hypothetical protein GOBAR_DD32585 [Gossypium barbadense]|nr:hypothetical protein GOBAR_DD32585 [Gossypium barbadense]